MSRLPRLPLLATAPLALLTVLLLLWSAAPVVGFVATALDAGRYRSAIDNPAARCPHDPIPTPGGCWSAATARVAVTGTDLEPNGTPDPYAVLAVPGHDPVRSDFLDGSHLAALVVGATVPVRYWHADLVRVEPPVARGATPIVLETRANPATRAGDFPFADALVALFALAGLLPAAAMLCRDLIAWMRRRRLEEAAEAATREAVARGEFGRGLARYGMSLAPAVDTSLVGRSARPATSPEPTVPVQVQAPAPPPPDTRPGGAGWNIRTR